MRRRRGLLVGVLVLAGLMVLPAAAMAAAPTIRESFSSPTIPLNSTRTLTFTIDNPDASLHAVGFDDTLPAGLRLVGTPATTCAAGVPLSTGPSDVSFTGEIVGDTPGCTVSASVQGVQVGHWEDPVSVTIDLGSASTDASVDVVAPPSISAAFGTSRLGLDGATPLTFTITNPNPSSALTGVAFTDALPAGLVIAGQPAAANGCGGTLTAVGGTDSLGLSGGQLGPGATCSVSATVAATATGIFTDTTTQVTSAEGGIGNTATAVLTVVRRPTMTPPSPVGAPDNRFKLSKPHVHRDGSIDFVVKVPGPGRIAVLEKVAGARVVFARAGRSARRARKLHLTIRPTAAGRRALQRRHGLRVTMTVGYTPTGGTRRTERRRLSVP